MEQKSLSLIIPAHNEAARLPETLAQVARFCAGLKQAYEVLLIENGSSDDTLQIAQGWQEKLPGLRVLSLSQPGKGNAIREGMHAAVNDLRVMLDADLSMSLDQVPGLLAALEAGADIAIASREAKGSKRVDEPLARHLIGRVFNLLVRLLVLPGIQDTQCGFKAFTARAAGDVFPRQSLDSWSFDVEVLAIARNLGYSIQEVPIVWVHHPGSKVRILRDSWRMLRDLLKIRKNLRERRYGPAAH